MTPTPGVLPVPVFSTSTIKSICIRIKNKPCQTADECSDPWGTDETEEQ